LYCTTEGRRNKDSDKDRDKKPKQARARSEDKYRKEKRIFGLPYDLSVYGSTALCWTLAVFSAS
jgi:hypothetical protein